MYVSHTVARRLGRQTYNPRPWRCSVITEIADSDKLSWDITQPCIPPALLNRAPASAGVKERKVAGVILYGMWFPIVVWWSSVTNCYIRFTYSPIRENVFTVSTQCRLEFCTWTLGTMNFDLGWPGTLLVQGHWNFTSNILKTVLQWWGRLSSCLIYSWAVPAHLYGSR